MILENEQQRLIATLKIMAAVDEWGLSSEQIMAVLDFPKGLTRGRHLQKFRDDTAFPDEAQITARMVPLLGIIDALRTTYPRNVQMGPRWMNTPHRRMQQRSPLHTMLEDGASGVITVLSELDCAYAWELNDAQNSR
jgi:hypothetical protein